MEQQSVAELASSGFLVVAAAITKVVASASFGALHLVGNPAVAVAFLLGAFPSFSSQRVAKIAVLALALTVFGYGELWVFEPWLNLGLQGLLSFQAEAARSPRSDIFSLGRHSAMRLRPSSSSVPRPISFSGPQSW